MIRIRDVLFAIAFGLAIGALIACNALDERPEGTAGLELMCFLISVRGAAEAASYAAKAPAVTYSTEA